MAHAQRQTVFVTCGACGAQVRWCVTAKTGARQPLDAKPQRLIQLDEAQDPPVGVVVEVWVPHHATCPQAQRFRRARPKAAG